MIELFDCQSCGHSRKYVKSVNMYKKFGQPPFIDQKCTCEKWTKNLGRPPPPHLDKIQKNSYFFREAFPESLFVRLD